MQDKAVEGGFNILDKLIDKTDATASVLLVLLIFAIIGICVLARLLYTQNKKQESIISKVVEKRVASIEADYQEKVAAMMTAYASLAQRIVDLTPEWARRIDRIGDDLRTIFALIKEVTNAAHEDNLKKVEVQGQIALAINSFPKLIEILLLRLIPELEKHFRGDGKDGSTSKTS